MIVVHHLNNSRSQRVLWLLEELERPYEVRRYERDAKTMLAPAALREVHPLGKSPVLQDGRRVIAESGAIVEYLVERYGQALRPADDSPDRWRYTYWLHFAEGSAMPPLLMKLVFDRIETAPMPFFAKPIARAIAGKVKKEFILPNIAAQLEYMNAELSARRPWFAGKAFSAADVMMSFPLEAAAARGGLGDRYPALAGFLERIHARPAYQRALERGGEYALLS